MMDHSTLMDRLNSLGSVSTSNSLYVHQYYHNNGVYNTFCDYCQARKKEELRMKEIRDKINNAPAPNCSLCGDKAPFGDERNLWIGYHSAWYHKLYYKIRSFFLV